MARASAPTSTRSWCRPCSPATSSWPTLSGPTRSPASNAPSQAAGATLWYLPPYSPDLNPIELCFAKLKALVRTARCRRTETLWPFLGECLAHFSPDECRNYFRHLRVLGRHTVMKSALVDRDELKFYCVFCDDGPRPTPDEKVRLTKELKQWLGGG